MFLQDYANILLIYHFLNHLAQNEHYFAARHDSVNVFISWHNKISKIGSLLVGNWQSVAKKLN